MKNAKHYKVAPGIYLNVSNQSKNPSIDIWVPKMRYPKIRIFGAPIESTGPVTVAS